jgi:diamine N-acetyltransferase
MRSVLKADASCAGRISDIGSVVWYETYSGLLPPGQIEYMLDKYQSPQAIIRQISEEGYSYYIMSVDGNDAGYIGIVPEIDSMYVSKIYVLKEYRRLGLARLGVEKAAEDTRALGLKKMYLRVNTGNEGAIATYRKLGFRMAYDDVADIGSGFFMDDHIMDYDVR